MITIEQIQKRLIKSISESIINQKELADALKISSSNISHYLKGDAMPTLTTLANLCKILDIDVNYILCQDIKE